MKASYYNIITRISDEDSVLFNTRTGRSISVSNERLSDYNRFLQSGPTSIEQDFVDYLKHYEFVIDSDVDELSFIRSNYHSSIDELDSLTITVGLTESCNFRCTYCYQSHDTKQYDDAIETVFLSKLSLLDTGEYKKLHVNWFGGEPLLKKGLLKKLSALAHQKSKQLALGFSQGITTNGSLLDQKSVEMLINLGVKQF
ncbi:MAG: radical SAM protein [Candidatus Thiodiazotropha endolucinida]|nr:radical SAM protein [Candidatus Thiodiazotropha endolucinida]